MKLQRFLNWVLAVTVFASLAGAWVFGYKLVSDLPGEFIPAGALPREALATSKLGRTTAEVVARLDRFVVAARDGRFWATVLRDVGEALLRFSIAQLHKLADIRRDTPSFSAPATSFSESGLGGSPPLATPTQRSSPAADCFDYAAAQEIVQLTNEKRVQAGLPALAIDAALMAMARKRSSELVQNFSHDGLRGDCSQCGENIGWRAAGSFTPLSQVTGWMNSTTGHRENMLYPTATRVGVGVCRASNGKVYSALDIMN
jgi:uncharacterized protein YkwD